MEKAVKVALCGVCGEEMMPSFTENFCVTCDGEWYCFVNEGEREETEELLETGPQYVYATKNLVEARARAGFQGHVVAVKRYGMVPVEREFGAWFSVYATFERWVERTQSRVRGSLQPSTPDQGQSSE